MEQDFPERRNSVECTAALLNAAAAGNPPAFLSFYDLSAPELYGLVLDIVSDSEAAEQILLDVFTGIWKDLPESQSETRPEFAQVLTTAHRCAVRHLRARKPRPEERQRLEPPFSGAEPADGTGKSGDLPKENAAAVMAALPPDQQLVIRFLYYSGLTAEEAAARLGWPEQTVRTCALLAMQAMHTPFSVLLGHSMDREKSAPEEPAAEEHADTAADYREKAALHALGALESFEGEIFENHMREGCRTCRRTTRQFADTVAAIGLVSPPKVPPAYLKDILAWRLERDSASPTPSPPSRRQPEIRLETPLFGSKPQRSGWRRFLPWLS